MFNRNAVIREMDKTDAIIVDLDNTLCKGRVSEGIGYGYLRRELDHRNYGNAVNGAITAFRIGRLLRTGDKDLAESNGIKLFYEALVRSGLGTREEMQELSYRHFQERSMGPVSELLLYSYNSKFLATLSGSTAAEVAVGYYRLDGFASNMDIFDERGLLCGISLVMRNGAEKLDVVRGFLSKKGIKISNCTVIGDSFVDMPLMNSSGLPIASPYAIREVNNIARFRIPRSIGNDS